MLIGKDHYYPFEMVLGGQSTPYADANKKNDYLYNGKEFQDELGLDWYDYGARFYDPQIGRWHSLDPMEQYESGYIYCGNDPINMIDPNGMWTIDNEHRGEASSFIEPNGRIIEHIDDGDPAVYVVFDQINWENNGKGKAGLPIVGWEIRIENIRKANIIHITTQYLIKILKKKLPL
jgi:RHS repeat-associated protein